MVNGREGRGRGGRSGGSDGRVRRVSVSGPEQKTKMRRKGS